MDANDHSTTHGRAVFLATALGVVVVLCGSLFLVLITGAVVFQLLLIPLLLVPLGLLHYYAWGKAMEDATAGEREEAELLERVKAKEAGDERFYPRE